MLAHYVIEEFTALLTRNGPLPHELNHWSATGGGSAHESCSIHLGGLVGFRVGRAGRRC